MTTSSELAGNCFVKMHSNYVTWNHPVESKFIYVIVNLTGTGSGHIDHVYTSSWMHTVSMRIFSDKTMLSYSNVVVKAISRPVRLLIKQIILMFFVQVYTLHPVISNHCQCTSRFHC